MTGHHFISYSGADGRDFAFRLHDTLCAGSPPVPVWLDKRDLKPGLDWDDQLVEAIRGCSSLLFIMTIDSVESASECKNEWTRALKYKKPIIPILLHSNAETPYGLGRRQHIDFTGPFEPSLARLRDHLFWLSSPAGVVQAMKDRLADSQRDLRRAPDPTQQVRIQDDIALLKSQIAEQERIVADPQGVAERVEESIARGLERERKPKAPVSGVSRSKFINPPPGVAPVYFQDRHIESRLIGDFLEDESRRLMTVVGRGGVGKTAMVCRLLKALESGRLPDDRGPLAVDGIVYLSATGTRRVTVPNLYADLGKLLPDDSAQKLDALYKNPQASTEAKMQTLLAEFPQGRTVLLLDNFEDVIDPATFDIRDAELDESLRALLSLPQHAVKVILTTRVAPRSLALVQPSRQTRIDLDEGLPSPFAENILREMDLDGKVGLKSAPQSLLDEARQRTRGFPRALEALFAILSADRDTSLREVLNETAMLLPENVVAVLVGEAFSRLEPAAQRVMEALAVYARPVTPTAVDYLLQPYLPGVNSAPVLNRLVNMQFVRKEGGSYYLHPIDREYALKQVPLGEIGDQNQAETPPFTQFALRHRGAEYFRQTRTPRENWRTIGDLTPQLAEFDLRYEGQDYNTAANVLLTIDWECLYLWGYYRVLIELHERLLGKLDGTLSEIISLGTLGSAYAKIGQIPKAITCQERALTIARERGARNHESAMLNNLALRYAETGHIARAIDYCNQSLPIAHKVSRPEEEAALRNSGNCYADLGQTTRAIHYYDQSLAIARELKDRKRESINLEKMAHVFLDRNECNRALQTYTQAIQIADGISFVEVQNAARLGLGLAHLFANDLSEARAGVEAACRYEVPKTLYKSYSLCGLIALRNQDYATARNALADAVSQCDTMLTHCDRYYDALDAKGVSLSGLALCASADYVPAAIGAYNAARAINRDTGIVGRVLRLFDALAVADTTGSLAGVRSVASGE